MTTTKQRSGRKPNKDGRGVLVTATVRPELHNELRSLAERAEEKFPRFIERVLRTYAQSHREAHQ